MTIHPYFCIVKYHEDSTIYQHPQGMTIPFVLLPWQMVKGDWRLCNL